MLIDSLKLGICFLLCFVFGFEVNSQDIADSSFDRKKSINRFGPVKSHFEAAANVTTVISRFSGNFTRPMEEDPYLVAFKYYFAKPRIAIRLGLNGDYQKDSKTDANAFIETIDKQFMPLLGFELRRIVAPRFEVYTGLDFRLYQTYSWLKTTIDQDISVLVSDRKGYGIGPNFGFTFFLTKNIRLFTEANLYFNSFQTTRTLTIATGTLTLEKSSSLQLKPVVPASLYLSLAF